MWFDPMYFLFLLPGILLAGWAQLKVKAAYATASKQRASSGMSGAEAAAQILAANGMRNVAIEQTHGFMGDHYDPRKKVLRLSEGVYGGRSLAAVGIAAHEAGHALQDAHGYAPLKLRNGIVPMASVGSNLSFGLLIAGMIFAMKPLLFAGIALFGVVVLFQLINLPVEFNASRRAREVLVSNGIVSHGEIAGVGKVLNAAALTYVAATITAILTLLYYLYRSGLLGGRNN